MNDQFNRFARWTADITGSAWACLLAALTIVIWLVTGPMFRFSDTWQLVINTGTTIITFLMVFLIQNTQNRDAKAVHLKLDELIRSHKSARNSMIDLEKLNDDQLARLQEEFNKICTEEDAAVSDAGEALHEDIANEMEKRRDQPSSKGDARSNQGARSRKA